MAGGVLGRVTPDEIRSGSESRLIVVDGRNAGFEGIAAFFASEVLAHNGKSFLTTGSSARVGLDELISIGR
jgi:hypothetical protein